MQFWILHSIFLAKLVTGAIETPYYGKSVGNLTERHHDVTGRVYIVDENTVRIVDFNYDGIGPAGVVYAGFVNDPDIENEPNDHGTVLPDPDGETTKIRAYNNEDILIKMPSNKSVRDLLWLSIWCVTHTTDFGSITFSQSVREDPPTEINLGPFNGRAHDLSSGNVILVDSRTIKINNLIYDGQGPAAWFLVGTVENDYKYVNDQATPKIPDETGSLERLKEYTGQTITITLPDNYDIRGSNLRWLNIYCIGATQNFGEVNIPLDVNVIPYLKDSTNCEEMNTNFQVSWEISGDDIKFKFVGKLADDEYMSFGLSGSQSASSMDDADVVVAYFSQNQAMADDYYLNQRAQCNANGVGACPDSRVSGASPSLSEVSGSNLDGITTVMFTRKLETGDTMGDTAYLASGDQYIVWAMGNLNSDLIATKHDITISQSKQIDFGRSKQNKCRPLQESSGPAPTKPEPWMECSICSEQDIRVTIGPSGGDRGYNAITKNNGWGIAIYLNGLLIPELYVERGQNYTFHIQTGSDTSNLAKYHPFYITDDPRGGHKQRTVDERQNIKIFAGLDQAGEPLPESVGNLCEYKQPRSVKVNDFATFPDYQIVLETDPEQCDKITETTKLMWTVPNDAPDLLYYQCWEHNWLGWKIHVKDPGQTPSCVPCSSASISARSIAVMITAICFKVLFG